MSSVEIGGVTTVSGNIDAARAARNTLDLLALLGLDVPVGIGADHPRVGRFRGGAPHVHGRNGVGGELLPPVGDPDPRSALTLFRDLARSCAGKLQILALGPLTNVAAMVDDESAGLIRRIVAMGGAIDVPGNVSAHAEANIDNDPEAADMVLASTVPMTLVPLDVTMQHRFTREHRDRLAAAPEAHRRHLAGMLDHYIDFYVNHVGQDGCSLHDPLAAAVLANDLAVQTRHIALEVGLTGPQRGRTLESRRPRRAVEIVLSAQKDTAEVIATRIGC